MATGLKIVLVFIGTLTLMIGGVGVMNIMLVSVTERTREIGVRKALGARRRHILLQFLLEALVITGAGGVVGILLTARRRQSRRRAAVPRAAHRRPDRRHRHPPHPDADVVIATTAILMVTGILSGLWPAFRASRLDPIESLRYE